MTTLQVWVDQDLCTGDGLCVDICPQVFVLRDGISYVTAPGAAPTYRGGAADAVTVPADLADAVLDAAEDCPGECIFVS